MTDYIEKTAVNQEPRRKPKQCIGTLPAELRNIPRWFAVKENKVPKTTGWQKPENQRLPADVHSSLIGFDTSGHGGSADYCLVDFDHVTDDDGNFLFDEAEHWFNFVTQSAQEPCFAERSISGHGLHILLLPTAGKFKLIANGKDGVLMIDAAADAKIELFYKTAGRYCLLTGNRFRCDADATVPRGEIADGILETLLDEIQRRNRQENPGSLFDPQITQSTPPERNSARTEPVSLPADDIDYDLFRAERMLDVINPRALTDSDWLAVNSACKNIGVTYSTLDAFNLRDPERYNDKENQTRFESLKSQNFDIETLHGVAKRFGYSEADSRRAWYELYPEKKPTHEDLRGKLDKATADDSPAQIIETIKGLLTWAKDKHGKPTRPKACPENMMLILKSDPNLRGLFGYDEFSDAKVFLRQAPWQKEPKLGGRWTDDDDKQLKCYIRETYFNFAPGEILQDYFVKVSAQNSFHPVKNFFASLPAWDGTQRAETLFVDFLRVDDTAFSREVTMNWLIAAVARIYHPGCRYQTALVFHGSQGVGKSYVLEKLGGDFYSAMIDSVDDAHAIDAIQNAWVCEFKEMAAMRKAELNATKSFIERNEDNRRFAYERRTKKVARHCVFAITVNDDNFLADMTGNRRYMILHSKSRKFEIVRGLTDDYVHQVWAEVLVRYNVLFKDGFDEDKLRLSYDAQIQAETVAEAYLRDDGMRGEIVAFLDKKIPPPVIWSLLTREERREFFKHDSIEIREAHRELNSRRRARGGRSLETDINELFLCFKAENKIEEGAPAYISTEERPISKNETVSFSKIYGSHLRQHICAAEIFCEGFGNDRRKSMNRIHEILPTIDGWRLGERIQKGDSAYSDQKKVFWRG